MRLNEDQDVLDLLHAARRAARRMKIQYDRWVPDADPDECWVECEVLWDALRPFEEEKA